MKIYRSSRSQMFSKIDVYQKFRNIHKKTRVLESLFNKVAGFIPATLLKRASKTGVCL